MLNTGDTAVNKASKNLCSHGTYILVENIDNKQIYQFTYNIKVVYI